MKKNKRKNFILGALASVVFLASSVGSMKPELVEQLDDDLKARYGHALTPKSKAAVRGWPDQHFYLLRRLAVTGDKEVIKAQIGAGRAEVIAQEDLRIAREAIRSLTANMARLQKEREEMRVDMAKAQAERERVFPEAAQRQALLREMERARADGLERFALAQETARVREEERDRALAEAARLQGLLDGALRTAEDRMRDQDAARRDLEEAQRHLVEAQRAAADKERECDAAQVDARRSEDLRAVLQQEMDELRARTAVEEERLRRVLAETERKRDEFAHALHDAQHAVRDREGERDRAQAEVLRAQKEKKAAEEARRGAEEARAQVSRQVRYMQTHILQGLNLTSADRRLVKELNHQLAKVTAEKEALQGHFRTLEAQLSTFKSRARAATEEARRAARAEGGEEKEESKIARLERELQLAHAKRNTMEEEVSALRAEIAALKGERETLSDERRRLEREIQGAEAINQDKLVRVEKFLQGLQNTLGGATFRLESPKKSPHIRVTLPGSPLRREAGSPRWFRQWHAGGEGTGGTGGKPRSP